MGKAHKLLDKATSPLLLEPDWESILNCCDAIRQGDITAKELVIAMRKKLTTESSNPHVVAHTLRVLESVVKNCGTTMHNEVFKADFLEILQNLAKTRSETAIRGKVLELVQAWACARVFKNNAVYTSALQTALSALKHEGYEFPPISSDTFSEAVFAAERAPEWKEGTACARCNAEFSLISRKHHCRNCGSVVCSQCSSKQIAIPRFGYEREVRVCDHCYENLRSGRAQSPTRSSSPSRVTSSGSAQSAPPSSSTPAPRSGAGSAPASNPDAERERQRREQEELDLAIALSQSEQDAKDRERRMGSSGSSATTSTLGSGLSSNAGTGQAGGIGAQNEQESELAKYLNRGLWELRATSINSAGTSSSSSASTGSGAGGQSVAQPQPQQQSQPQPLQQPQPSAPFMTPSLEQTLTPKLANGETSAPVTNGPSTGTAPNPASKATPSIELVTSPEDREFAENMKRTIDAFTQRMKGDLQRGRPLASDTQLQTLFSTLRQMQTHLSELKQKNESVRAHYEELQEKIMAVKDARAALDGLRNEERERRRLQQEEMARQNQIAMLQKLATIRLKKQEYLERQRVEAMAAYATPAHLAAQASQLVGQHASTLPYPYSMPPGASYMQQGMPYGAGASLPYPSLGVQATQGQQSLYANVGAYQPTQSQPGPPQAGYDYSGQMQQPLPSGQLYDQSGQAQGPATLMPPPLATLSALPSIPPPTLTHPTAQLTMPPQQAPVTSPYSTPQTLGAPISSLPPAHMQQVAQPNVGYYISAGGPPSQVVAPGAIPPSAQLYYGQPQVPAAQGYPAPSQVPAAQQLNQSQMIASSPASSELLISFD